MKTGGDVAAANQAVVVCDVEDMFARMLDDLCEEFASMTVEDIAEGVRTWTLFEEEQQDIEMSHDEEPVVGHSTRDTPMIAAPAPLTLTAPMHDQITAANAEVSVHSTPDPTRVAAVPVNCTETNYLDSPAVVNAVAATVARSVIAVPVEDAPVVNVAQDRDTAARKDAPAGEVAGEVPVVQEAPGIDVVTSRAVIDGRHSNAGIIDVPSCDAASSAPRKKRKQWNAEDTQCAIALAPASRIGRMKQDAGTISSPSCVRRPFPASPCEKQIAGRKKNRDRDRDTAVDCEEKKIGENQAEPLVRPTKRRRIPKQSTQRTVPLNFNLGGDCMVAVNEDLQSESTRRIVPLNFNLGGDCMVAVNDDVQSEGTKRIVPLNFSLGDCIVAPNLNFSLGDCIVAPNEDLERESTKRIVPLHFNLGELIVVPRDGSGNKEDHFSKRQEVDLDELVRYETLDSDSELV